ncbi:YihY/virulence factor BrkB family protein [Agromyces soli]
MSGRGRRGGANPGTEQDASPGDRGNGSAEASAAGALTATARAELDRAENAARDRFEVVAAPLRERFDEPIQKVTDLTQRTMALFPVRVWRRFLAQNGFILSAGLSYEALFAVFAAVYVGFAVAGIWLTTNTEAMEALFGLVNTLAPGLVGDEGIITVADLDAAMSTSTGLFGWTGAIALVGLLWTAIGWITYSRIAVRSIFGLPKDKRAYLLLKARDLVAGLCFGAVLFLAALISLGVTSFTGWLFDLLGWDSSSTWFKLTIQLGTLVLVFIIDTLALAVLFRFLSGASVPWRRMWTGSLLGSAALSVLQLFSGLIVSSTTSNPLLATFAVFIGMLLWFHLTSIVILVAAAWIAVEAADANESLRRVTAEQLEAERRAEEHRALVTAARVRVREATRELEASNWFGRFSARRRLADAQQQLDDLEREAPPAPVRR